MVYFKADKISDSIQFSNSSSIMNTMIPEKTLQRFWTVEKYKVQKKTVCSMGSFGNQRLALNFYSPSFQEW